MVGKWLLDDHHDNKTTATLFPTLVLGDKKPVIKKGAAVLKRVLQQQRGAYYAFSKNSVNSLPFVFLFIAHAFIAIVFAYSIGQQTAWRGAIAMA